MAVLTRPLSASEVQKAKTAEKDYELFGGQGLTLMVKTSGKKIWRFRYKRPGSTSGGALFISFTRPLNNAGRYRCSSSCRYVFST